MVAICVCITIFVIFPNGIELNSELDVIYVPTDAGDTGQGLFDNGGDEEEIITFRGMNKTWVEIEGYAQVAPYLQAFKVYQQGTDNTTI